MRFLDRRAELERLDGLVARGGGLAVVYGRRRIGKTRLLVEWVRKHGGVYTVADRSAPDVQRRYFADAVGTRLSGFGEVEYRDWRTLLTRLAREAALAGWTGPLVFDELPYLVLGSPELPAILQRWVDHEAAGLVVALAGSSQHMMQGLALSGDAPLYGRAREILEIGPLPPGLLREALGGGSAREILERWTAWGGVPRYWELADGIGGGTVAAIDRLVLDPLGPLHREPDRLIVEDLPPAIEVRPLLDAVGAGAHRVSEIAGRLGRPATSLGRPIQRLQGMGLVRREVPFGEPERGTKRSLYRIADPFTRLWFRVVAPHRAQLAVATPEGRAALLARAWPALLGEAWEDLCRLLTPALGGDSALGRLGPWEPPSRWWRGREAEWDLVARSADGRRVLFGEVKVGTPSVVAEAAALAKRPPPNVTLGSGVKPVRALFVVDPEVTAPRGEVGDVLVVSGEDLMGAAEGG